MPHIHELIDFAVTVYAVYGEKVLLVKHRALGIWLPVGGHIELDEDPETAALREAEEESGLKGLELLGERPDVAMPNGRFLIAPPYLDIHRISDTHQHIGMSYFARSPTDHVVRQESESDDIRWFSDADLDDPVYELLPQIRFLAHEAIKCCAPATST